MICDDAAFLLQPTTPLPSCRPVRNNTQLKDQFLVSVSASTAACPRVALWIAGSRARLILRLADVIINFPVQSPLTHQQLEPHEGGSGTWAGFGHVFCVWGGSPESPAVFFFSPPFSFKCKCSHFPWQHSKCGCILYDGHVWLFCLKRYWTFLWHTQVWWIPQKVT